MILREIESLMLAIQFYTRIPIPSWVQYSDATQHGSTKYLPLVGLFVGAIGAGISFLLLPHVSVYLALTISMAVTLFLTGAFHEDGFADFCDGFGGGYTKGRILEIMKDSRIGTYGTVGLCLLLGIKMLTLAETPVEHIPFIILFGHSISRAVPVLFLFTSSYVSLNGKSNHLQKNISTVALLFSMTCALIPVGLYDWKLLATFSTLLVPTFLIFRWYVLKHIGGYTGDVLGALQQLSELIFYSAILFTPLLAL